MTRRRYRIGRPCQDCGRREKPTTTIYWWASGWAYVVCGECIRPYRRSILAPCSPACVHNAADPPTRYRPTHAAHR